MCENKKQDFQTSLLLLCLFYLPPAMRFLLIPHSPCLCLCFCLCLYLCLAPDFSLLLRQASDAESPLPLLHCS
jgi:hypothetical protein